MGPNAEFLLCEYLPYTTHFITPNSMMPDGIGRFDYITASAIKFHSVKGKLWTLSDWCCFLDHLEHKMLTGQGGLYFSFNFREGRIYSEYEENTFRQMNDLFIRRGFSCPAYGIYVSGKLTLTMKARSVPRDSE
jgi:hypothetical protein